VALAQIGEFSFLLASLGLQLGALPEGAMNPIVAAAILSIMINPLIYRLVMPAERMFQRAPRLWRLLNRRAALESGVPVASQTEADAAHRAVVVGYGPTGRILCRILKRHGIEPTVIEMNIDTHRALRQQGTETVYGDANSREVLEKAGVGRADSLILTASGSSSATEAVRAARELNPGIHIAARAGLVAEAAALRRAGATEVYSGEGEVALALASGLLRKLGATPDQLDEAQERIRREIEAG
jgi:CPA2 family monovalent cation:H+ antiporter-2